jgi:predicted Zn-dependent protease
VYESLEATQKQLETQADSLTRQADELNHLTKQINEVGSRGNVLVEQYNERVAQYNARFGTSREFTQGDYQGDAIHIYTFADEIELRQVLVHEFGHALSLGHVDDPGAIMYRLLSTQPDEVKLTAADLAEFRRVCTESSGWSTLWPDTY